MEFHHISVLLEETIAALAIRPDGIYVDGTAGGGGHSSRIAQQLTTGRLIALDKDPDAVAAATARLAPYGERAMVLQRDFADMAQVLEELGIPAVDGILLDLGVSSYQLDTPERGFSYQHDAPLDMRMSQKGLSAYDLVNTMEEKGLAEIIRRYGEEKFAARIAARIVEARRQGPVETTGQLAQIVKEAIPAAARREGGHPAKRTFQALRIAVNDELDNLSRCLDTAFDCLAPGGRFAVITFHSLEDRITKQAFAGYCRGCTCPPDFPVCVCGKKPRARLVTRKPVEASAQELEENNRSRSARLRVIERLEG